MGLPGLQRLDLGAPRASRGPHEGQRRVYFLAPWGMQFELVSYPYGRAFFNAEAAEQADNAGFPVEATA